MATGVKSWSKTAANNSTADSAAPWPEGMLPGQVNDSSRGGMASVAKWRDDISGVIVTSGTLTAYTVASNQNFESLAVLDGMVIAFTPHVTNGTAPTLSVDGLTAKPLRAAHGADLQSNVLLAGTPYVALYNNGNGEFVLQGMTANPYGIPLAGGLDYWADVSPGSAYAFPTGQAISRTAYAALFALIGTKFGSGDGTTTFNLPDKRERVSVMVTDTASRLTSSYFGGDSTKIGAVGGGESFVLQTTNLPPYTPSGTVSSTVTGSVTVTGYATGFATGAGDPAHPAMNSNGTSTYSVSGTAFGSLSGVAQGGTSAPLRTVPPTIICNYIMRII